MTNFEKYSKGMDTTKFAVVNGKPVDCNILVSPCYKCDFYNNEDPTCHSARMEWLKAEYKEPKITIPEGTPIDAKVLVSDYGTDWCKRHYAGFKDGKHYVWPGGKTSWTSEPEELSLWEYMKLYE